MPTTFSPLGLGTGAPKCLITGKLRPQLTGVIVPNIAEVKPETFSALLDAIEDFQAANEVAWYRGISDASYKLSPTLFRHPEKTEISAIARLEAEVTTRFVQRSVPFLSRTLTDDWDKLFLMQHFGVPTRLLDWTENPFIGAYFALTGIPKRANADAVIWMCNPASWNRGVLHHVSYDGGVLDESSDKIRYFRPTTNLEEMPNYAVMIYGTYNSARIVAQRGGFALFGKGLKPLEDSYVDGNFQDGILKKIVIGRDLVPELKNSLLRKGITESVVFPDLEGLSKEIRRMFGFV